MYPIPGVSVLLTIASLILVILTIFSGINPGFMEDYHLLYFNTSSLGENFNASLKIRATIPEPTAPPTLLNRFHAAPIQERGKGHILNGATRVLTKTTSAKKSVNTAAKGAATSATKSVSTAAKGSATSAASVAISSLSGIEDDVAEKLSKKLGVKGFYSIHLINLCYGDFEPNATNPSATLNATNCTTPFDYGSLNFSALLDHQLSVGSHSLNLADLGLTKDIQDKINDIPKIIRAIVATYIIAAGFICFGLIASVAAIILIPHPSGQMIVTGNIGLASLAVIFLLIGNLITTIGSSKVVEEVTKHGNHLGLYAERGVKYMAVTWATFGIMLLTVFYWVYEFFAEKRRGSEEINRAIGGFSFSPKSEPAWSDTSSGLASRENSFPHQNRAGVFPPTHAPGGRPVSPMDDIPLDEPNYGRGTHEPGPISPLEQGGYSRYYQSSF